MRDKMHYPATWFSLAALAIALLIGLLPAHARPAGDGPATGRVRQNFNAGWRFHLGDAAGAEQPGFDDRAWQAVGLPHSFSTPYFQAPEVYVGYGWYRKELVLKALPDGRHAGTVHAGRQRQKPAVEPVHAGDGLVRHC